jgi:phage terminase large subunit-like protein
LKSTNIAKCIVDKFPENYTQLPCYIGFDLGPIWDITAAVFLFVDEENDKIYVEPMMWIPKQSAMDYQDSHGIPYYQWNQSGHISFVEARTLDTPHKKLIANEIVARAKTCSNIQQVCYDRYKASEVIFELEQAGLQCEPIASTMGGIGLASKEFERRVIDASVKWQQNECFLWQLAHVAIESDKNGNIRPVKPHANEKGDGLSHKKVDAILATMYAFSRAYLHLMKQNGDDEAIEGWNGEIPYV